MEIVANILRVAEEKRLGIQKKLKPLLLYLFMILLLAQPILDISAYFAVDVLPISISLVLRGIFLALSLGLTFLVTRNAKAYLLFYGSVVLFFAVHMLVALQGGYVNPYKDFEIFVKIAQLPMMTYAFMQFFRREHDVTTVYGNAFTANLYIIVLSVLISMVTGSSASTYSYTESGVLGWFYNGNAQSAILVLLVPVALGYLLSKKNPIWTVLTVLAGFSYLFFIGTRTAYYAIFIIGISAIAISLIRRKKEGVSSHLPVKLGAIALAMTISLIFFTSSPMYQTRLEHNQNMQDRYDEILRFDESEAITTGQKRLLYETYCADLVETFGFERVLEAYDGEVDLGTLADVRLAKRTFAHLAFEEAPLSEKLFGFEYSRFTASTGRVMEPENDVPTIFYLYGIVGFSLYVGVGLYFIFLVLRDLIRKKKEFFTLRITMSLVGLALIAASSLFAGHTLVRPSVSIYVSATLAYLYWYTSLQEQGKVDKE